MTKSTTYAIALALIADAIMVAAAGVNYNSPANAGALPFAGTPGVETPVRATKGDRLNGRPQFRKIAGVSVVLRDFSQTIR
ncbi:MAG: hypothetical protein OEL78_09230 [Hyphomicrobiales bacterium]|nr:hypothetical protein [Hyphomicrobiales bacterium]